MSEFVCSNCNKAGFIVSVEVVCEAFPCGPDGKGGIEYEASSETWNVDRSHYQCTNCESYFTEAEVLALEVVE